MNSGGYIGIIIGIVVFIVLKTSKTEPFCLTCSNQKSLDELSVKTKLNCSLHCLPLEAEEQQAQEQASQFHSIFGPISEYRRIAGLH